jgi:hypothetical protein
VDCAVDAAFVSLLADAPPLAQENREASNMAARTAMSFFMGVSLKKKWYVRVILIILLDS